MKEVSFIIKKDKNAEPHMRYILCVMINGKCVEAPRYSELDDALCEVADYIEEFPHNDNFKIEIRL